MPVIGRLDEQVDEVLIRPASRRGRAGDSDAPPERPSGAELTRATTPADSKSPAPARDDAPASDDARNARAELPVWML